MNLPFLLKNEINSIPKETIEKSDVSKLNTMSVSLKKLDLKFIEMVIVSRMQNCLSSKTIKFLFQIWISYAP